MNNIKRMRNERGFTLIELLVVIVILGILAAVVVFAVSGLTDRGQDSSCKIDERTVRTAMESYYSQNDAYPTGTDAEIQALLSPDFLAEPSTLHSITNTAAAGPYTIDGVGKCA